VLCTLDSDSPCRSESIKRLRISVLPAAAGKRATTVWLRKSDRLIAQYAFRIWFLIYYVLLIKIGLRRPANKVIIPTIIIITLIMIRIVNSVAIKPIITLMMENCPFLVFFLSFFFPFLRTSTLYSLFSVFLRSSWITMSFTFREASSDTRSPLSRNKNTMARRKKNSACLFYGRRCERNVIL